MIDLEKAIPQYALNKSELDAYKKLCEKENAEIKEAMEILGKDTVEVGTYIAKRIVQKRENVNEEILLNVAHFYDLGNIIKTKEYIDFDALEDAIYKGDIPNEVLLEMDKAREVKEVVTLKISKVKEKK